MSVSFLQLPHLVVLMPRAETRGCAGGPADPPPRCWGHGGISGVPACVPSPLAQPGLCITLARCLRARAVGSRVWPQELEQEAWGFHRAVES